MPDAPTTPAATPAARTRRTRVDKQRNRDHILDIAEQFFSEQGVAGPMDTIAKRAGIGAGTLYRHFPTREDLLAALLQARSEHLATRRDELLQEADSALALEQWLDAMSEFLNVFDGLPEPLRAALTEKASPLAITCRGFVTDTDQFLSAAQRDGHAQPGVYGRELFLSVLATAWVADAALADESSAQSLRALVRTGWALDPPLPVVAATASSRARSSTASSSTSPRSPRSPRSR